MWHRNEPNNHSLVSLSSLWQTICGCAVRHTNLTAITYHREISLLPPHGYQRHRPQGHLARGCIQLSTATESHYCPTSASLAPGAGNGAPGGSPRGTPSSPPPPQTLTWWYKPSISNNPEEGDCRLMVQALRHDRACAQTDRIHVDPRLRCWQKLAKLFWSLYSEIQRSYRSTKVILRLSSTNWN